MESIVVYVSYFALLFFPFVMGLIIGMEREISIKQKTTYSLITALVLTLFAFIGIGLAYLLLSLSDISYMAGVILLVAGFVTFKKGGKSNTFIYSMDVSTNKDYFLASVGSGLSIMLTTMGCYMYSKHSLFIPAVFFLLVMGFNLAGLSAGKNIHSIKIMKILMIIAGVLLFLVGLFLTMQLFLAR
ncbi:MAG: hypothetical protein PHR20_04910 [Bacteroidales bacterium]|nr:hypothetical protein [Bacteroidales bacterium]